MPNRFVHCNQPLRCCAASSDHGGGAGERVLDREHLFNRLIENSNDAIFAKTLDGIIMAWNGAAERMYGYTAAEAIGKRIDIIVPLSHRSEVDHILSKIARGEQIEHFETVRQRKDGSLLDVSISVSPLLDAVGETIGASIIARNISERKQIEQQFRVLIEASPNGILLVDEQGFIVLVNAESERLFGFVRNELIGQPVELLVPPSLRSHHVEHRSLFIANSERRPMGVGRDLQGLRKDGSTFAIEVGLNPIATTNSVQTLCTVVDITIRRSIEQALAYQANLVNHISDAIISTDMSFVISNWNEGAQQMYGWSSNEVVGRNASDILKTQYETDTPSHVRESFSKQGYWKGEAIQYHKDGSKLYVLASVVLITDAAGKPVGVVSVNRDITERKQFEAALQQSEQRFRQLAESLPQLVWTCEPDGVCDFLGPQWVAYTGIPAEQQLGYGWLEQVHPDDREPTINAWNKAVANASNFQCEFRLRCYDGAYRWFDTRAVRLTTSNGRLMKWFGSNTDITERREIEDVRRESNALLGNVLNNLFTFVGVLLPNGTLLETNRAPLDIAHLTIDDVHGKKFWDCYWWNFSAELQNQLRAACDRAASGERSRYDVDIRVANEQQITIDFMLAPLRNENGTITHLIASGVDITERKQAERKVAAQTHELRRSNLELEQFAYVASHDLQEPLRMVASYTELLGERYRGQLDARADKYITYAVEGARRMQQLINDLLAYSRVGTQGKPLEPVDIEHVLARVLSVLQPHIVRTNATIAVGAMPTVMADSLQMSQLFQNLVGNALKFVGPNPPHIVISARPNATMWTFSIADNGIGIEAEYAERVFQIFQRLHERSKYDGSGIGLSIAKRIVERHGGAIWFESQPGQGTTFYFTLANAQKGT